VGDVVGCTVVTLRSDAQYAMTSEKALDSAELVAKHWLHVGPSEMTTGHRQLESE